MSAPYAYYAYDSDPYGLRADSQSFIDAQADSYRMRGMVDRPRYPEPPMESLPAEAVSGSYSGHYRMPPQGLVLASSHRLASFADIISLDEALRAGPSTVIEKLHLDGFELIAYYRLSATWLAILARLPNLKTLRFSGSDDQRLLVGHAVSPFPSLGPIPNVRGALQKVTEVFIDNVRCLTLNHLLSHLTGLSSLQFLSLRHILCEQPPDPAEPPVWHHHFARLSHVAVHDCDDPTSLAWLYATPPLINRLHVMQKEIPHVDPFLAFFDARYIMLCIRAFCKVQNSLVAKVKTSHYICRGSGESPWCM